MLLEEWKSEQWPSWAQQHRRRALLLAAAFTAIITPMMGFLYYAVSNLFYINYLNSVSSALSISSMGKILTIMLALFPVSFLYSRSVQGKNVIDCIERGTIDATYRF